MDKEQKQIVDETNVQPKEKATYPTEVIELPSTGKLYPPGHPLVSGRLEIKYPTAREEDILTSKNLIQKGVVIDKFIESLIVDKSIKLDDLLLGDKNAIIIAARILAYGKDYEVEIKCPSCDVKHTEKLDISMIEPKEVKILSKLKQGQNQFQFTLPASKRTVVFKTLTHFDERMIEMELKNLKKFNKKGIDHEVTTRLRYAIISIDGEIENLKSIVESMLSIDSKALRDYLNEITPDIDLNFNYECEECGHEERIGVPLGVNFFWPTWYI